VSNFLWDNIFRKDAQEKELIQRLKENILFESLSYKELRFIEKIVHERVYRANEVIFRQGEAGVGMYIIHKGNVDIYVNEAAAGSEESEQETQVTQLSEGDFFGEISLVEANGRRTASAITSTDTRLIGFFRPDLVELLNRNPHVGAKVVFKLAEVLGRRLAETTNKISLVKQELHRINQRRKARS
jgi:CRP-like cAMP-binding protein